MADRVHASHNSLPTLLETATDPERETQRVEARIGIGSSAVREMLKHGAGAK
jgi:hypothetical protein